MVVPSLENPRYSYGLGKIFQEFYSYHAMPFLDELLIFRPHNIYGPDMGNLHVVPQLIEKCTKAKKLGSTFYIQGDGSQTRSFCYIDDFILGFRLILQSENHKMVFNIGNDSEISILEVAQHIAALVDYRGEIGFSAVPQGATSRRLPDISRLRSLGYTPTVSLSQGLAECVRQFSNV
jgi:UDP-glucose 4-epimerase